MVKHLSPCEYGRTTMACYCTAERRAYMAQFEQGKRDYARGAYTPNPPRAYLAGWTAAADRQHTER